MWVFLVKEYFIITHVNFTKKENLDTLLGVSALGVLPDVDHKLCEFDSRVNHRAINVHYEYKQRGLAASDVSKRNDCIYEIIVDSV